jgi:hypothetical protein
LPQRINPDVDIRIPAMPRPRGLLRCTLAQGCGQREAANMAVGVNSKEMQVFVFELGPPAHHLWTRRHAPAAVICRAGLRRETKR